jgi:cytochrome c-type biogenesis protein
MVDAPGLALAFAAGVVSFVSPCCLPLVPGYLAAVTGVAPDQRTGRADRRIMGRALLFVATFSLIFILLGLTATAAGALLFDNQETLTTVAGVVIIAMGLVFVGALFFTRLNAVWHPRGLIERAGTGGPVLVGAAFAIAWTPCFGPTIGAILTLAATQASVVQGGMLLAIYSLGLGVPFLLTALAASAGTERFAWLRRHRLGVQAAAGVLLIAMGVLVLTDQLFLINIEIQQALDRLGLNFWQSV